MTAEWQQAEETRKAIRRMAAVLWQQAEDTRKAIQKEWNKTRYQQHTDQKQRLT